MARSWSRSTTTVLALVAGAGLGAPALASAQAGDREACDTGRVGELATARDPDVAAALENDGEVVLTCRDLNGRGPREALFIITGGGTGGAFWGGIVVDRDPAPVIGAWVAGRQKLAFGFRRGLPAIAWPRYRRGEPNCCPRGGWTVRRFRSAGRGFVVRSTDRLRSNAYPLRRDR